MSIQAQNCLERKIHYFSRFRFCLMFSFLSYVFGRVLKHFGVWKHAMFKVKKGWKLTSNEANADLFCVDIDLKSSINFLHIEMSIVIGSPSSKTL